MPITHAFVSAIPDGLDDTVVRPSDWNANHTGLTSMFVTRETPTGAVNGVNTIFTLANTPVAGSEHVYRNGVLQEPGGVEYTISGTTITFVSPPNTGNLIRVSYIKP